MSIQLQLAIPFFAVFALLIGVAIWRKYLKAETFIICLASLGIGVFVVMSNMSIQAHEQQIKKEEITEIADTKDFSLALAKQYILDGNYEEAMEILRSLLKENANDSAIQLAAARCSILMRDYSGAVQLYKQQSNVDAELNNALALLSSTKVNDNASATYLKDMGYDPSKYGLTVSTTPSIDRTEAEKTIITIIKTDIEQVEKDKGADYVEAIKQVSSITNQFNNYIKSDDNTNSSAIKEETQTFLQKLSSILDKFSDLSTNSYVRIARVKGYVITEEYSQIAKKADRSSVPEELVILSHLLVNDVITTNDFSSDFFLIKNDKKTNLSSVLKQCEKVLDKQKDAVSPEQLKDYKEKVTDFRHILNSPALYTLKHDLLEEAQNGDISIQSKCYLALAKLESKYGNEDKSQEYISDALGTASNSDDVNYKIPMNQMTGIIQGTADASEIMNIAIYVDKALDHSLPLDIKVHEIPTPETEENKFSDQMTNMVTQNTATINIGVIDKNEFSTVKAKVQLDSKKWTTIEDLKKHLKIYDCGSLITDFEIEKVEFQSSKIILLCDCSGSMSGTEDTMRQVIIDFSNTMGEGEQVAVVGFESSISFQTEFSGDKSVVASYADYIFAGGGTALYSSLLHCGDLHTQDINSNNIIIAMTDGNDGDWATEEMIRENISKMASDKNITVYTIGLGSVDAEYLQKIAEYGNGSFLYASEKENLQSFYSFIHGQLSNQYIITYNAKNLTRNERTLEISLDEELGSKKKTYYLIEPTDTDGNPDSENPYTVEESNITVSGLTTKFLYQSSAEQTIFIKGTGFTQDDYITVRLLGNIKYNVSASYVDENTYSVVIPSAISTGVYDLEVCIAESSIELKKELTVGTIEGGKNVSFGDYNFTALNSHIDDNGCTVLSGNVVMNGWLRFKGDITISYDYYDKTKARITDNYGFYVSFSKDLAGGLAKTLAEKGVSVSFDPLGYFVISNKEYNPSKYKEFETETSRYTNSLNLLTLLCEDFNIAVYPDMLGLTGINFEINLPFQNQLMGGWEQDPDRAVSGSSDCLISANKISTVSTVKYNDSKDFTMVTLPLKLNTLEANIDTLNDNYSVRANVGFKAVKNMEGLEFYIGILGGKFDSLELKTLGTSVNLTTAPIPVTMSDFAFKIDNFSQQDSSLNTLQNLLEKEVEVDFKVSAANLNDYAPDIAELISKDGDVAFAELKDCKLKVKLKDFRMTFDAKMVLATVLDLGDVSVSLGSFDYKNELLDLATDKESGLRVKVNLNILKWDSEHLDLDLTGNTEVCIGYPYSGLWFNGKADVGLCWWIFENEVSASGDVLIGAYENSLGRFQFSIIMRGTDISGTKTGFHAYVTADSGFKVHKL